MSQILLELTPFGITPLFWSSLYEPFEAIPMLQTVGILVVPIAVWSTLYQRFSTVLLIAARRSGEVRNEQYYSKSGVQGDQGNWDRNPGHKIYFELTNLAKSTSKISKWKGMKVGSHYRASETVPLLSSYGRGVLLDVNRIVIRGYYCRSETSHGDRTFPDFKVLWNKAELTLIKSIKNKVWPRVTKEHYQALESLLENICQLSYIGRNAEALELIDRYSMSTIVRCVAINKVRLNSGGSPGLDSEVLINNYDKLRIFKATGEFKYYDNKPVDIKKVMIPKKNGKVRSIGVGNIKDRVLQTQLCLLLDPYYEAKYSEDMYGFRKGRNCLQAVGLLHKIVSITNKERLGVALLDIKSCFDSIPHVKIMECVEIPSKWKPLFNKWIKACIWSENKNLGPTTIGVAQGSVLGPLICNVIMLNALYESNGNLTKTNNLKIFNGLKASFINDDGRSTRCIRKIISYADDIVITTNCNTELNMLVEVVRNALLKFGLNLSDEKSHIVQYNSNKSCKFDYLGFTFLFIPKSSANYGGLIKKGETLDYRKDVVSSGTHLLYPNKDAYRKVKSKLSDVIETLSRNDVISVINKCNLIIKGWTYYFSWNNCYPRLNSLDHFIYKRFKRRLVKKFRSRGRLRIKWVVSTFMLCKTEGKTDVSTISPYARRWHIHARLPATADNKKRFKDTLFLHLFTKAWKVSQISKCIISPKFRHKPYYLNKVDYSASQALVTSARIISSNYKQILFIKQKGICAHCLLPFDNFNQSHLPITSNLSFDSDETEIHHILPIAVGKRLGAKIHIKYNELKNLVLLHKSCHFDITSKS